ncbi:MAG: hypothetical protein NW223_00695 [Hyphomicrobiaceae bacterium]|nr:hypothetical protein [Hyphomicrobiaceae bacterium]
MRFAIGALALGLFALPAQAFQETTVGGKPATEVAPAAPPVASELPKGTPAAPQPGKGLQLNVPELSLGGKTGTEVKIPGLGTVGVLPKLDFGLELLYGATDPKTGVPDVKDESNDVRIRGTLKHRF